MSSTALPFRNFLSCVAARLGGGLPRRRRLCRMTSAYGKSILACLTKLAGSGPRCPASTEGPRRAPNHLQKAATFPRHCRVSHHQPTQDFSHDKLSRHALPEMRRPTQHRHSGHRVNQGLPERHRRRRFRLRRPRLYPRKHGMLRRVRVLVHRRGVLARRNDVFGLIPLAPARKRRSAEGACHIRTLHRSAAPSPNNSTARRCDRAMWRGSSRRGAGQTPLRRRMIEDMQVRNLAPRTQISYIEQVDRFARHFRKSPEHLGPAEIRAWQIYLGVTCRFVQNRNASGLLADLMRKRCLRRAPAGFAQAIEHVLVVLQQEPGRAFADVS